MNRISVSRITWVQPIELSNRKMQAYRINIAIYALIRFVFTLFILLNLSVQLSSQELRGDENNWRTLLSVGNIDKVQDIENQLFASSGDIFFVVDKKNPKNILFFDRSVGVSDIGVKQFSYNVEQKVLLVFYHSGIIDLILPTGIARISAIADNIRLREKGINQIVFYENKAFLAGQFGLSVIDLNTAQVQSTAFAGENVNAVACHQGNIYILMKQELKKAKLSSNLQDPEQWTNQPLMLQHPNQLLVRENTLYILNHSKDGNSSDPNEGKLFTIPLSDLSAPPTDYQNNVRAIQQTQAGAVLISDNSIRLLRTSQKDDIVIPTANRILSVSANVSENELWMADGDKIYRVDLSSAPPQLNSFEIDYSGPWDNRYFYTTVEHDRFYSVSGGRDYNRFNLSGVIKIFDGTGWTNLSPRDVQEKTKIPFRDPVSIAIDPKNPSHFFVGSWGEGLYEFSDFGASINRFDESNSSLTTAVAGNPNYIRVGSLTFDAKGNLWMAQGSVEKNIAVKTSSGEFVSHNYPAINFVNSFGPMLSLPGGTKWLIIHHRGDGMNGLFVFNDNGTPTDASDDATLLINQFTDRTGKIISATNYRSMAIDKNGALWIGSNRGPIYVHNAAAVLKQQKSPIGVRPVGGKEPNLFYVMDNVPITSIVVDEVNNKWIGTQEDGLYLLSPDGAMVLEHFTTNNSPLLTNNIRTLSLDSNKGLLYIGTSAGLMTYNVGATGSFDQLRSQIHVYPNPLRPEHNDKITITGLAAGMQIKVLDLAGRLLFQDITVTSEISFNARMANGERWPSGVYQLLVSDTSGKRGHTVRFAVIN